MKSIRSIVTALLPLPGAAKRHGGSPASPCRPIGALLLSLTCAPVMAGEALDRQIDQAVRQYFTRQLAETAADRGWQDSRFTHKVVALPDGAPTEPCEQALQVNDGEQNWSGYGRLRLTLTCLAPVWSVDITTQATVFIQAVAAAQVIERGQLITPPMLAYREVTVTRQSAGLFNQVNEVAGLSAKRRTRSQQVLTRDMLATPLLVRRGQRVTVMASHGEIHASTAGEALQDGRQGKVIRVRNIASGKVIEARVIGNGKVSSLFGGSAK